MATATKKAGATATRVEGENEVDGKSGKSNGNDNKEGDCIARKRATARNNGNDTMGIKTTTMQQIQ
jgi:hypothetical protein